MQAVLASNVAQPRTLRSAAGGLTPALAASPPACYNQRTMLTARWRFWLAGLMLIALPFKGLAALGVVPCCPPGVVAVAGHEGHDLHASHGAQAPTEAAVSDPSMTSADHHHGSTEPGAKLTKPLLCCGGAAMLTQVELPAFAPTAAADPQADTGSRYLSAALAGTDKPPRS